MCPFKLIGIFAIIPVTLLLVVSFFVLFAVRKTDSAGLKAFGYVIAALLWLSSLLIFSTAVYSIATGKYPMMGMMPGGMGVYTPHISMGMPMSGMMPQQAQPGEKKPCKMMEGSQQGQTMK